MNKSDCVIITEQQKNDLLKMAKTYDFGVNELFIQLLVDSTWALGIEQITSGEFIELYIELWDMGEIQKLKIREVTQNEYQWYQDFLLEKKKLSNLTNKE